MLGRDAEHCIVGRGQACPPRCSLYREALRLLGGIQELSGDPPRAAHCNVSFFLGWLPRACLM